MASPVVPSHSASNGPVHAPIRLQLKGDTSNHRALTLPINSTRIPASVHTTSISVSPSTVSLQSSPDILHAHDSAAQGSVSPLQLPASPAFVSPPLPTGQSSMSEALQAKSPGLIRRLSGRAASRFVRKRQSSNNVRSRDQSVGPLVTRRRSGSKTGYDSDMATEGYSTVEEDFSPLDAMSMAIPSTPASTQSRSRKPSRAEDYDPPIIPTELLCPTRLTKITRKGSRKQIDLVLDPQAAKLTWKSLSKGLYIDDIQAIRIKGDAKKNRDDVFIEAEAENRCLTIVYADTNRSKGRSVKEMNLIFPDDEKLFESWTATLQRLYKYRHDLIVGLAGPGLDESTLRSRWKQEMDKVFQGQARAAAQEALDFNGVERVCRTLNINWSTDTIRTKFNKADSSGSGLLGYGQFRAFVKDVKVRSDVLDVFEQIPKENVNGLNLREFLGFLQDCQGVSVASHLSYWESVFFRFVQEDQQEVTRQSSNTHLLMRFGAFNAFLSSAHNSIVRLGAIEGTLEQPLNEYYISSSHNTYLLGRQIFGASSTEGYIRALQEGCRCVEIDCWDGNDMYRNQPTVTHGYTGTSKILFSDCISVISRYAFDASPYPLILSLEVHCCAAQQEIMVEIMLKEFGDRLVKDVLDPNSQTLPSPEQLKGRILVKAKTRPTERTAAPERPSEVRVHTRQRSVSSPAAQQQIYISSPVRPIMPLSSSPSTNSLGHNSPPMPGINDVPRFSSSSDDSDIGQPSPNKATKRTEKTKAKLVASLDKLCVYTRGVKFNDFTSDGSCSYNHIFSLAEGTFEKLSRDRDQAAHLERHNLECLMRVYPKQKRVTSTNFDPLQCWKKGVQMVALNYQTHDVAKQINDAMFASGPDRSGYVLKPRNLRPLNGISEHITEALTPTSLKTVNFTVKVISAQFLPRARGSNNSQVPSPYIEVQVYIPDDKSCGTINSNGGGYEVAIRDKSSPCLSSRRRTDVFPNNGYDPLFNATFEFEVTTNYPELVFIRWNVWNWSDASSFNSNEGTMPEATFTAKLMSLQEGYRHLPLRNHLGEQFSFSTIFCHIIKGEEQPAHIRATTPSAKRGLLRRASQALKGKSSGDKQKNSNISSSS